MLNLFQKYRRPSAQARDQRKIFAEYFYGAEDHAWIVADADMKRSFDLLISYLPSALLATLMRTPLAFVPSQIFHRANPARYQMSNTVVVFPEYQRLLKRGGNEAAAYLAHEVALVLYELEDVEKDPIMAEVEADKFVCDIGLADDLERLLLAMDESTEKRLRLTYLTFKSLGIS